MKLGVSVVFALMVSLPAAAQDRGSAFVAGSVSAANTESRTEIALTGAFGFRFSRVVSFVLEATAVPSAEPVFPTNPVILSAGAAPPSTSVAIFPGPTYSNLGGRIVLLTNTARIDIPTTSTRVTPFFSAGGGVANVRRTADFSYELPLPLFPPGTPTLPVRPFFQHITSSSTEMALTLGGGAGVRVAKSLWLDVDLRLFRLLGDDDRNLGRFGVGVRYAF
jgi:opacity protein-like surface antigen